MICSYAQDFSRTFGSITQYEKEMTSYDKDPEAEALVIYNIGKSSFIRDESGFDILFEYRTKIKIFNKAGYKWADVTIPYYREGNIYEKVYDIKAYTYNYENGSLKRTELDEDNCYDEKLNERWNLKKFAIPGVKDGSIIEYTYKIETPYKFNLQDWTFQQKIPVLYSEYKVSMVPFFEYIFLLQGASKFDEQESYLDKGLKRYLGAIEYNDMIHEYIMKDLPAFRDESYITSIDDYIIKIDFQLAKVNRTDGLVTEIMSTWTKLNNDFIKYDNFGRYIKAGQRFAKKELSDLLSGSQDREHFNKIVENVKYNYNWNGNNGKYAIKSIKEFTKEKTGNAAEINLFLAGILREAGFDATPVLLSTREHGKVKTNYPFRHFFNYVIVMVKIDDKPVLCDATDTYCKNDMIPFRCLNGQGLLVEKDKENWVWLANTKLSRRTTTIDLEFSSDLDSITGDFTVITNNYDAVYYRSKYQDKPEDIEKLISEKNLQIVNDISTENYKDIEKPYKIFYKAAMPVEQIDNKLFFSPFMNMPVNRSPFTQSKRTYPVDMTYKKSRNYTARINIPEGCKISSIPENLEIDNKLITVDYKVIKGDELIISAFYTLKKASYDPLYYSKLRYYYNEIVKKFNEKIALEKVE